MCLLSDTDTRLDKIAACMDEIENIRKQYAAGRWTSALNNAVGHLDWLDELHSLLYNG